MRAQESTMTHRARSRLTLVAVAIAASILGSCTARTPAPVVVPVPPPVTPIAAPLAPPVVPPMAPKLSRRQQMTSILTALNQGNSGEARTTVVAMLAEHPGDAFAKDMLRQLDTDPKVLLGEHSYPYQIRRSETLSTIAARRLSNPNRFWALARYNNIAVPSTAEAGQIIQIPGTAPVPVVRKAETATTGKVLPPAAVIERSAAPRIDAAGAARLRRAGLDEMARGSIEKAVPLLERALALDPANTTIQADLAQARKVQRAVRQN